MGTDVDVSAPRLAMTTLVVDDYDRAIAFFVDGLGFALVCDAPVDAHKRWVVVRAGHHDLLLAKAATARQRARIGDQTGGRVGFFLHTDDFARDSARIEAAGGRLTETPRREPYGLVAKFADPWGNLWDLIAPAADPPA